MDKPVTSSWGLSTEAVTDDIDIYEMSKGIIKQIEPVKDKILQLIEAQNLTPRLEAVLTLSLDREHSRPDVGFGSRTIRFLSEIGAFINVEYELSE